MATPINQSAPSAQEELGNLIQSLHEQGLLRLANDAVNSHPQWTRTLGGIVDDTVEKEQLGDALPALFEFSRLVQQLHRQGVLELANNAVATHPQWMASIGQLADDYVKKEQLQDALPAFAEFSRLVQKLHRQGLLELAHNIVATHPQWMATISGMLDNALRGKDVDRMVQNVSTLADMASTVLSRIEPEQLQKLFTALGDSLEHVATYQPEQGKAAAPGLMGVYRLCKDESLWRALAPIIDGLRVFGKGLDRKAG